MPLAGPGRGRRPRPGNRPLPRCRRRPLRPRPRRRGRSSRSFAPSTTKTPSDWRTLRRWTSRRSRWTRWWRGPSCGQGASTVSAPTAAGVAGRRRRRQGRLGQGDQLGEGIGVGHGQIGQDLAVDGDVGVAQAGDQPAVAQAVGPGPGVDALDPEPAEVTLAGPAVAVGVLQRVHDGFVGGTKAPAAVAVVTLGLLEDGIAVLLAVDGALHPGHVQLPSMRSILCPVVRGPVAAGPLVRSGGCARRR